MAESTVTPLQLIAGMGLYNNTALTANTAVANNVAAYQSTALLAPLQATLTAAGSLGLSAGTITALNSIGGNVSGNYCPALGDAVPSNVSISTSTGLTSVIVSSGSTLLGSGDLSKFVQAYGAAQGFISVTNPLIISVNNANTDDFLGPTFSNMDNLITADITKITLALTEFGEDLAALGELFTLDNYGTPAALLQQLSDVGNITSGTVPAVRDALTAQGLTEQNIADLVNNNVESLFNPDGLTAPQFDALQKRAYPGLCNVTGADLVEVLDILGVTTPNITAMCQLLNPVKIFPKSFASLTLPTPNGPLLIYNTDGTVNNQIAPILNSQALSPVGCDELGKIIPQDQAAANRSLQISFAQLKGADSITLPQLARVLT